MAVPKYDDLFNPVLGALLALGGSGRVDEIDEERLRFLSYLKTMLAGLRSCNG